MQISESEKLIMDILWLSSPLTAKDIIDQVDKDLKWQDKTIKTLINRLLKKQAIAFEKQGREYCYYPVLEQEEFLESVTKNFLQRMFDGKVSSLVAAFAKKEKLSNQEIEELKALIKELDK